MALIEEKRAIAARSSLINYGFYLGATADNLSDIAAAAPDKIAGIKIFMGASTGDMLVDDEKTLEKIFTVRTDINRHTLRKFRSALPAA